MKKTTADERRGIHNLDFADDIALLSLKFCDLHEKSERLTEEAARVGLKLNARH